MLDTTFIPAAIYDPKINNKPFKFRTCMIYEYKMQKIRKERKKTHRIKYRKWF